MVYIRPQPYKCLKCGFEMNFGPQEHYSFLPTLENTPFCYRCLIKFIADNVPLMERATK